MNRKLIVILILLGLLASTSLTIAQDTTFALTIMHTNDVHSNHKPSLAGKGGAARQATVVAQIRDEVDNSLLLDAGDRFGGGYLHYIHLGQDNVQIMNALGYDAMTLGNHEFDEGDAVLAAFVDGVDFPVLSANIDFSASDILAGKVLPYVVLDVGREQIGVIGLTTTDGDPEQNMGAELVMSDDYAGIAQNAVDELTALGVNKIILLTHLGYAPPGFGNVHDVEIAAVLSGVDIIVGGHSHTLLSNQYSGAAGEYPTVLESVSGEPILIVQAEKFTQYLGRLDVEFDSDGVLTDWGGDVIELSKDIVPDPDVEAIIDSF